MYNTHLMSLPLSFTKEHLKRFKRHSQITRVRLRFGLKISRIMKILNEYTKEKLALLKPFLPYGVLESWEDLDPRLYHAVHIYWLKFYGLWYNTVSKSSFQFWTQIVYGFLVLWLVCFLPGIGEVVYLLRRRDNIGEIAEGYLL